MIAWLIAIGWVFAPFWFNPNAFEWDRVVEVRCSPPVCRLHPLTPLLSVSAFACVCVQDVGEFRAWMQRKEGDGDKSWRAWWRDELSYLPEVDPINRLLLCALSGRHALVGVALLWYNQSGWVEIGVVAGVMCGAWLFYACLSHPLAIYYQFHVRAVQGMYALCFACFLSVCVVRVLFSGDLPLICVVLRCGLLWCSDVFRGVGDDHHFRVCDVLHHCQRHRPTHNDCHLPHLHRRICGQCDGHFGYVLCVWLCFL
jgi:hypothetical protein